MSIAEPPLIWDNHTCLPLRLEDHRYLPELRRLRAAGVNMAAVNIGYGDQDAADHLRIIAHFRQWIKERPEEFQLVGSVADIEAVRRSGKLGLFFDIEGANAIEDRLSLIELYYDLGVRWMLIAYNKNNRAGGGCLDDDQGLTPFGRSMIDEMARVGMVLCCSHTGQRTALEAIASSSNPVIFSHSNARAVHDHPRNINDHVIRACAERGGVIGINGIGPFLGQGDMVKLFAQHLDHVVEVAGIDHAAIGLDYVYDIADLIETVRSQPQIFGADSHQSDDHFRCVAPEALPDIILELERLGYTPADLSKVLGENLRRVATAVWK
jgi:membrane dipeptidase